MTESRRQIVDASLNDRPRRPSGCPDPLGHVLGMAPRHRQKRRDQLPETAVPAIPRWVAIAASALNQLGSVRIPSENSRKDYTPPK
jgi:hypothetical protein